MPCGRYYILGVGDLGQATSDLSGLVRKAWEAHMSVWAAAARESAGAPHASLCSVLVGIVKKTTLLLVRGRHMILCFTQDKKHHGMGGRLNLSTNRIFAVRCGNIHVGSA